MSRVIACVAAVLATATVARAQECAEGRESIGGSCCWPGQTFSTDAHRCEGPPRCPAGRVEHGESCVLPRRAVAPTQPSFPSVQPGDRLLPMTSVYAPLTSGPTPSTTTDDAWPAVRESGALHRADMVRGRDEALITLALTLFDVGWVLGWVGVVVDEATHGCFGGSCQSWPLAFVPLGGGMAASTTNFSANFRMNAFGLGFGIASGLLQGIGLIAAAIAVENRTSEVAFLDVSASDVSLTFVPSAPDALAGFSLAGTF